MRRSAFAIRDATATSGDTLLSAACCSRLVNSCPISGKVRPPNNITFVNAIMAIVVFVGDWKIRNDWRDTNTRVFTPDGLLRYIRDQQPQLKRNEIELIASHLERSARA
jgi:hypothetical protein